MNLNKSTKILINLVLILVMALLLKSLITIPKDLYGKGNFEYQTFNTLPDKYERGDDNKAIEGVLNEMAKKGWKLHSWVAISGCLIFER